MSLVAPCAGGPENSQPPLYVINDGIEALELLRGGNGKEPLAKPYIIILIRICRAWTGVNFGDIFRKDTNLKEAIIFIMTTSRDEAD